MKKISLLLFAFFIISPTSFAQNSGEEIFDTSFVHEIRITFENPNFWQVLTENYENSLVNDIPTNVPYLAGTISFDGNILDSVGIRQKGFSSHFASNPLKKSIKLDLNEFISGQTYDGMKKLNLNNGVGDPAMQRDLLGYGMMREAGIRAPRTAHARVFINDTYWGLYLLLEQVDKTFVDNNFASGDGDLYKNIGFSNLEWNGPNQNDYVESIALRTNKTTSDFSDYIEFVDILNNSTNAEFADSIVKVFNVDYYLRVLAIDIMTDNWDSYLDHGRNFYLYHEPLSDQFFWIPWDYNLSMGGNLFPGNGGGGSQLPNDAADCQSIINGTCPFPATDSIFLETISRDNFCCNNEWDNICQALYDTIQSQGIMVDSLPPNAADCVSITNGSCPHPATDLIFLEVIDIDNDCCNGDWTTSCQVKYDSIVTSNGPTFFDFPLVGSTPGKVLINRIMGVPAFRERYLDYCCQILEHNFTIERLEPIIDYHGALIAEAVEQDNNYIFSFDDFNYDISEGDASNDTPALKEFLNRRIPLLEQNLMDLNHTCMSTVSAIDWHDVVINEFVASNDSLSGIADQDGDFDDWIELYNNTNTTIDLTDFFLTDNHLSKKRWAFPAGTNIGADEYLVVWADKDIDQDGFHADFKLSGSGEQLMLSHYDGTVIDSVTYGAQTTNIPMARIPNGTGDFVPAVSTIGAFNSNTVATNKVEVLDFKIYPNPAQDLVRLSFDKNKYRGAMNIRVTNLLGQVVYNLSDSEAGNTYTGHSNLEISVENWSAGVYIVAIQQDGFRGVKKLVVE